MPKIIAILFFGATLHLHASITLTTAFSIPVPGTGIAAQSLTTIACENVQVDIVHGVANDQCIFCNDTVNAGKEVSCTQIPGTAPIFLQFVHGTCVLTIVYQGINIGGTTYGTTACSSAWNFDTTQTAAAVQNATELLLLPFNASTNPSGLGIVQGTQGATW